MRKRGDLIYWRLYEHLRRDVQIGPAMLERCHSFAELRTFHEETGCTCNKW